MLVQASSIRISRRILIHFHTRMFKHMWNDNQNDKSSHNTIVLDTLANTVLISNSPLI